MMITTHDFDLSCDCSNCWETGSELSQQWVSEGCPGTFEGWLAETWPEDLHDNRWWGLSDDDYDPELTVARDGRLAHVVLHYDNRDAVTGSHLVFAPPAQQYGFRLQRWIAWGRMVAEAAAAPCPDCGVAPLSSCTCPF